MSKISFRFFNNHEVRAIWDEENAKWWFSVQDVVGAINDQSDYKKNRNYWKYLKTKLRKEGNELVSATNQLKLPAAVCFSFSNRSVSSKEYVLPSICDFT